MMTAPAARNRCTMSASLAAAAAVFRITEPAKVDLPGNVEQILDGDYSPIERPKRFVLAEATVRGLRLPAR